MSEFTGPRRIPPMPPVPPEDSLEGQVDLYKKLQDLSERTARVTRMLEGKEFNVDFQRSVELKLLAIARPQRETTHNGPTEPDTLAEIKPFLSPDITPVTIRFPLYILSPEMIGKLESLDRLQTLAPASSLVIDSIHIDPPTPPPTDPDQLPLFNTSPTSVPGFPPLIPFRFTDAQIASESDETPQELSTNVHPQSSDEEMPEWMKGHIQQTYATSWSDRIADSLLSAFVSFFRLFK